MFRKVLIANRGEIAVRVAATCQAMGIVAAAVYSDADAGALHVRVADEAYPIGPAPATQSYLNVEAIMEAAERASADALHPGYGFLSENPALAEACREAGITFVGPSPEAMRLLGSKIAAKRLAEAAGVPTVPGYHGEQQDDDRLLARAREIGTPLLIKASAGGGGRGMREVRSLAAFVDALEAARREARAAFGDDTMLLERLVERPRHVEFQIVGDAGGAVVHLGERECSVQRRHQKIIEEAPSPAVSSALRAEMGSAAVRVARAAGYTNAGTVEFMLAPDGPYYFLEMNARLQVEHPVTEYVTGLDLVALQLRLAAGLPLPFDQDAVTLRGHALECRIYAEDPANNFLPSTGRLLAFAPPRGPGVRVDAGVEAGDEVIITYDPMLAKLITAGETRAQALQRALWALQRFAVLGVATNVPFLARAVGHPAFVAGDLSTDFVREHLATQPHKPPAPGHDALLLAALYMATAPLATHSSPYDPWRTDASWTAAVRTVRLDDGTNEYTVELTRRGDMGWTARLDDRLYEVDGAQHNGADGLTVRIEGRVLHGQVRREDGALLIALGAQTRRLALAMPPDVDHVGRRPTSSEGESTLTAPMPGTIIKVYVSPGERVEPHQRVMVLEAMKMEHVLEAPHAGVVRAVLHKEGDLVAAGATLAQIDVE